jgi:transcriptional regulator with XRE-family HTH domain
MSHNNGHNYFGVWLRDEIHANGWTQSEAARQSALRGSAAGNALTQSQISRVISGKPPTTEFCRGVALMLGLPLETVMEKAGLLQRTPESLPPRVKSLLKRLDVFTELERQMVLDVWDAALLAAEVSKAPRSYPVAHQ